MMGVSEIICIPILGLDLWEHAYWVDHDGESTATYLDNFWPNVDWELISANYEKYNVQN